MSPPPLPWPGAGRPAPRPLARRSAGLLLAAALAASACVRHAELRDDPDSGFAARPRFDAGVLPPVDAALRPEGDGGCQTRPTGDCVGANDFPCAFAGWVEEVVAGCAAASGCDAVGWLEVRMAADGCVDGLFMEAPHEPLVACLTEELAAVRCPCGVTERQVFLGFATRPGCPAP